MENSLLRPADAEQDFEQLAAWFTLLEDWTSTTDGLKKYYRQNYDRIMQQVVVDESREGELLGFYWATRDRLIPGLATFYLYVRPEARRQGIGGRLYAQMTPAVHSAGVKTMRTSLINPSPEALAFAGRRGFSELRRATLMELDLETFDEHPFTALIAPLEEQGFQFTSMEALGDSEEVQRKLYELNETTGMDIPGSDGPPSWESFEDFQEKVCRADWYRPAGQMVVIDRASGEFVAMSAITRFEDYAYNLYTGVDRRYRGLTLAQAVKALALRYARQELGVRTVRTHHNNQNQPIFAIDRKLGYVPISETVVMEKEL